MVAMETTYFAKLFKIAAILFCPFWHAKSQDSENMILPERSYGATDCGKAARKVLGFSDNGRRIVGGQPAEFGRWPWMVALLYKEKFRCGGAILNKHWIITAQHCLFNLDMPSFIIRMGELVLNSNEEELPHEDYKIEKIIHHPNFSPKSLLHDISLVKLNAPLRFKPHIRAICLPDAEYFDENAYVLGWGKLREGAKVSETPKHLQEVSLPLISQPICRAILASSGQLITSDYKVICAGSAEGGQDACQGDSGSPLMIEKNNVWLLIGIVSFGLGCARPNIPGIYSDVFQYKEWIMQNAFV